MKIHRLFVFIVSWLLGAAVPLLAADAPRESIKLEIVTLRGFEKYDALLSQPGYLAIALENNGLSPSLSSKLKVGDGGRSLEIRGAVIGFVGKSGAVYSYEAGIMLGVGESKLTFPVTVDISAIKSGKATVTLSPPLAGMIPMDIIERIRLKVQLIANPSAQKTMLDYLDRLSETRQAAGGGDPFLNAILLDAYSKSGGPAGLGAGDAGDALPISEQWLLILTLVIWLIVVPTVLLVQRFRRNRRQAA